MHRAIAGFNVWAMVFIGGSLVLTLAESPWALPASIFATVFALLAQCSIFALFMGASKLIKEHVQLFALPERFVARINQLMIPLFRWATVGSLSVLLLAILAGLTASGEVSAAAQAAVSVLVLAVLGWANTREYPRLKGMHDLLREMEAALPDEGGEAVAQAAAAAAPDLRARALVYVGSTVLAMVLGYKYIAGLPVPPLGMALGIGFSLGSLALAAAVTVLGARR